MVPENGYFFGSLVKIDSASYYVYCRTLLSKLEVIIEYYYSLRFHPPNQFHVVSYESVVQRIHVRSYAHIYNEVCTLCVTSCVTYT